MKTAQGGRMTGIRFFLFFMMVLFLQIAGPMEAHAAGKAVFPKKATVVVGESATLKFTGKAKKITYSTGNSKVVKILKKKKTGVVIQAKSAGTVKITAKAGGKKYVCVVTSSPIAPELSLKVGETKKLRLFGAGGTAKWSIRKSAAKIQTKNGSGATIKGVSAGVSVVTVTVGKKSYSCRVTVEKSASRKVTMKARLTIEAGKTAVLKLENNKDKVIWSSSNRSVVRIQSQNNRRAKLKGVAAGTAKITAKVGKKKYVCRVTVEDEKEQEQEQESETEPTYSYEISPLLAPFNIFYYVRTDDPDVSDLAFEDESSVFYASGDEKDRLVLCENLFLDVKYENRDTARVKDGYIFKSENYKTDGGTFRLQKAEKTSYGWLGEYEDTGRTFNCAQVEPTERYLIDTYTTPSMGFFEKLDAVQKALNDLAVYPRSTLDATQKRPSTPFPLLAVSPYPELSLNDWYLPYEYSESGLLVNNLYPFVLDSLGFPGEIAAVAKMLDSSCTVSSGVFHYLVDITWNGEKRSYGGAGAGSNHPLDSSYVKETFLFDGSADDLSTNTSMDRLAQQRKEYGDLAEKDAEYYEDLITGATYAKTIGMGSWIRVGTEGFNLSAQSYAYVTRGCRYDADDEDARPYSVEDIWVDGRYINKNNRFELGTKFAEHSTSDIMIRNMSYTDKWGKQACGDVIFSYDEETDTWFSRAWASFSSFTSAVYSYEELPDDMILTQEEVRAMNVDGNADLLPTSGYIYDGSVYPGTPF